jgi:Protein of unknown function (DUF3768)
MTDKTVMSLDAQREASARLNDLVRARVADEGGFVSSAGFARLSSQDQQAVRALVRVYDAWGIQDSIAGTRDFGVVFKLADGRWTTSTPDGEGWLGAAFWRIDCYEHDQDTPALTPWDARTTRRILTLLLPEEY